MANAIVNSSDPSFGCGVQKFGEQVDHIGGHCAGGSKRGWDDDFVVSEVAVDTHSTSFESLDVLSYSEAYIAPSFTGMCNERVLVHFIG